ncbi:MAG: S-layer homology domain-containing protein, partial [Deltaproteobacteria bacterium]|nr:S-layer homology domain-containing protein [Deltaproteobacteria bacterium]
MIFRKMKILSAGVCLLFLFACGPKAVAPRAELDTPEHHVSNGNKLLKSGKIDDAFKEFNRAKDLDPKHSPAYLGLGLVYGLKGDFENGFKAMKTAKKYAKVKDEEVAVEIGYMRLFIMGKEKVEKNWLKEVEHKYKKAVKVSPDLPDPYYYMGIAYKMSFEFRQAALEFTRVLDLDKDYVEEANREYAIIQKIERAMPGTSVGKKIALLEKITRADVAALFIEEVNIDELFSKRSPKKFDTSFKSPDKGFASGEYVKVPPATDIDDHVLKADIDAVVAMGIKGLQPFPDHTFKPEQNVTRAEFAMMVEDILVKITRNEKLATMFIGNNSPFPDLRSDLPFFNAVMVCTTRGILEPKDIGTGEFDPMGV